VTRLLDVNLLIRIFKRREAGQMFRVRLQDRPDHYPGIKEGHRA
jgi:hypothetical protein